MYDNTQWMKLYGQNGQGNQLQMIHVNARTKIIEFYFIVKHSQYKNETWHYENIWIYFGDGGDDNNT